MVSRRKSTAFGVTPRNIIANNLLDFLVSLRCHHMFYAIFGFLVFCLFFFFRAALAAYGGSQARGPVKAESASLHHSCSKLGSEPSLQPNHSSQQHWIPDPLSETRD